MSSLKQPLSALALESPDFAPTKVKYSFPGGGGTILKYIVWFIIILIVVWVILIATKPTWVQKQNELGEYVGYVDQGKAFVWALIIAIIIIVIVAIIQAATSGPKVKEIDYGF